MVLPRIKFARSPGFTFIEIMVALSISAMIAIVLYGAFEGTFSSKERVEAIQDRYQQVRITLNRMCKEISMAYLSNHKNIIKQFLVQTIFKGTANELYFSTFGHQRILADSKESDQAVIGYHMRPNLEEPNKMQLVRRETNRIPEDKPEKGGFIYVLIDDIVAIRFFFWDPSVEIGGDGWIENWDSYNEQKDQLPARVKIVLTVNDPGGRPLTFITQAQINLTTPLNF